VDAQLAEVAPGLRMEGGASSGLGHSPNAIGRLNDPTSHTSSRRKGRIAHLYCISYVYCTRPGPSKALAPRGCDRIEM